MQLFCAQNFNFAFKLLLELKVFSPKFWGGFLKKNSHGFKFKEQFYPPLCATILLALASRETLNLHAHRVDSISQLAVTDRAPEWRITRGYYT